ncbi:MBL fold metallo-hydrolase [Streptomyces sp. NPDC090499]|uniref:MBL fold metallo-hydrolase n=1 Tax=Streptomyces sp. NPDC090499 TaxID=3365965 RepID=UPI0037F97C20
MLNGGTDMLKKIRDDLWETRGESPFPGLTTHAYLWTPPSGGNVLFYSTVTDADFDEIERRGGVAHQYLSHHDEAGPMVREIARWFGARLHGGLGDARQIEKVAGGGGMRLDHRQVDENGVEVIPTPGHTPGSTCYLVNGAGGESYLFTGDTIYTERDGSWAAGNLSFSDPVALATSLRLIAALRPDLVASSAAPGGAGTHDLRGDDWAGKVRQALASLSH